MLVTLARGCRGCEGARFDYEDHDGRRSQRRVAPHQIVHTGRRWYLVALDLDRQAWRTFRIDRITTATLTGHRYELEDPPDAVAMVSEGTTLLPWRIEAQIRVAMSLEEALRRFPPAVGHVEAVPDDSGVVMLRVAANQLAPLVAFVCGIEADYEVIGPSELREDLLVLGERLVRNNPAGSTA